MNFKRQIDEDLEFIQEQYLHLNNNLSKKEYAFNYWVLMKLFNIDEELVNDCITEYRDDGVDNYVFFEDSKELYVVQNKYYDNTKLHYDYIQKEFLLKPIDTLLNNNYKRSPELQKIFNKYKDDSEFQVFLYLFVSNNHQDNRIIDQFKKFNKESNKYNIKARISSRVFYLDDIEETYFGGRKKERKNFSCEFLTINKGTVLSINSDAYQLPNLIEAKYVLTPVNQIYEILKYSKEKQYPLFSANIREYLGKKGINKKIADTLENPEDRDNFFYYNNGITVICDKISQKTQSRGKYSNVVETDNPQIVNGAQTVNTIFDVLDNYHPEEREKLFANSYVMVKLLELDDDNEENKKLYEDIVRYNNSQNRIDEKYFEAVNQVYLNIQDDFEDRGYFLLVKQSDKEKFRNKYSNNIDAVTAKANLFSNNFEIETSKFNDLLIPLDKLLQVVLAFTKGGFEAYSKKNRVLKPDDEINKHVHEYIKKITREELLLLFLFYKKAEQEKKASEDGRTPIPYYVIGFLGSDIRQNDLEVSNILKEFKHNKHLIDKLYKVYKLISRKYHQFTNAENIDYQKMIKSKINSERFYKAKSMALDDVKLDDKDGYNAYKKYMIKK